MSLFIRHSSNDLTMKYTTSKMPVTWMACQICENVPSLAAIATKARKKNNVVLLGITTNIIPTTVLRQRNNLGNCHEQ